MHACFRTWTAARTCSGTLTVSRNGWGSGTSSFGISPLCSECLAPTSSSAICTRYLGRNGSNALASGSGRCWARATGPAGALSFESYRRKADAGLNRVRSLWNSKIRCRMVMLYAQAELHNLLVLGTTNRSEYLTGWFTKYGDGAVDLEVILPLYKTRVSELAVKLDVPGAIRAKTPSGDILPGVTDEEMLGVPYSVLDRILLGLQRKLAETDIACSLEIGLETVRRVAALISSSRFSREGALFPDLVID